MMPKRVTRSFSKISFEEFLTLKSLAIEKLDDRIGTLGEPLIAFQTLRTHTNRKHNGNEMKS